MSFKGNLKKLIAILSASVIVVSAAPYQIMAAEVSDQTESAAEDGGQMESSVEDGSQTESIAEAGEQIESAIANGEQTESIVGVGDQTEVSDEAGDLLGAASTIKVEFYSNYGTLSQKTRTVTVGSTYGNNANPLPYPIAGEYFFKGWFTQPDGDVNNPGVEINQDTRVDDTETYVQDGVVKLYAHWTRKVSDARLVATSLTLSGKVGLNYYMSFPEKVALDGGAKVIIRDLTDGSSKMYMIKDCLNGIEDGGDVYKFTYDLNAKNMADRLELKVFAGNGAQQPLINSYGYAIANNAYNYSVYDYIAAVSKLDDSSADITKLKSLAASLKVYGDFARYYFGYNCAGLNPSTASIDGYDKTAIGHEKIVSGALPSGVKYVGSTLVLKSGTSIRHYFAINEGVDINSLAFTVNGVAVPANQIIAKDNLYYIEVANVPAQTLGLPYTLGETTSGFSINYSALSYAYNCLDKSEDDSLKNVSKALYGYYLSAIDYFGNPEDGEGGYIAPDTDKTNNRFDETNLIITNGSGAVLKGWNQASVNGKVYKYYSNPSTGKVVTGFNCIDGTLYYFGQTATDVGRMKTGFFDVANAADRKYGEDFYDNTPGASNRYYADTEGVLHGAGWDKMTAKQLPAGNDTYKNEQVWSYYFAPNLPTDSLHKADSFSGGVKTAANVSIKSKAAEAVTGDAFIKNGNVITLASLGVSNDNVLKDDLSLYISLAESQGLTSSNYYRFNKNSGARDRAVMYFYGNYYGWGTGEMWNYWPGSPNKPWTYLDNDQKNTIMSQAMWINSDTKMASMADDFITVNGEEHKRAFNDLGAFPMISSRYVGDPENDGSMASRYRFTNPNEYDHTTHQDYVSGCTYNQSTNKFEFTGIADGNVDVYDTIYYSFEEYKKYISKYGTNNLVLMGSSSGAGICVTLMMLANANGYAQPNKAILFSPWLDVSMTAGNPVTNVNSGTDLGTLRYWGSAYTRDASYDSAYSAHPGPGRYYWMASPVWGCKTTSNTGSYAGLNNIYMYTGSDDPCRAACNVFYNGVKSANQSATIFNNVYYGLNGMGHGFMFVSTTKTAEVLRDAAMRVMVE